MTRKIILSLLAVVFATTIKAAIGDWKLHMSYHNATYCEAVDDKIYILASGSLYSYNKEDSEVRTYDKISHLNDVNISFIRYCKEIDALVLVYKNANIDILYSDESVYNISDFKNKTLTNKVINNVSLIGTTAYISTNFGIVVLDVEKKEFSNTYTINKNITACYYLNNKIYAACNEGIICGDTNENLLDPNNWKIINSTKITEFGEFNGELLFTVSNKGIYTLNSNNSLKEIINSGGTKYTYLYQHNGKLIAGSNNKLLILNSLTDYNTYKLDGNSVFVRVNGNEYWNCKGYKGFVSAKTEENSIVDNSESYTPVSPVRNYCEFMKFSGDKLLIAGGNLNYFDINFYDPTIMEYYYDEERWFNYSEDDVKTALAGKKYRNICTVDENPNETGHIFAGSFGHGIFEFKDGEFINYYNFDNSPIETVVNNSYNYIRVSKVKFDEDGNLWVVNTGTKDIIKVLKTDGTWQKINYKEIEYQPTISDIYFDSRGWLWAVSLQQDAGLFCAKINETPFDTSDDTKKAWYSNFTNQDGISYEINQIYGFVEDKEGKIWVGTNTGLFIIENPRTFFDNGIFTQIKVPRNDGTNLADYLLTGTFIQSICIDGANRKWIGTKYNGIYLISADGLETIHHFTTENSPLPSNSIVSIAVNNKNGEVFIGTENGLVSYMGNATEAHETLDESNIHAYPNPVRADYSGDISIVGLTLDCNVKIVDTAGSLIHEGTSIGGSFSWDGRNKKGEKVASGVYYVLTYDENGNEGVATKILVIR